MDRSEWGLILATIAAIAFAAWVDGISGVVMVVLGFCLSVATVRFMFWRERTLEKRAEQAKREARRRASPL